MCNGSACAGFAQDRQKFKNIMHTNQQTGPVYIVGAGLFGSVLAERIVNVLQRPVVIFERALI